MNTVKAGLASIRGMTREAKASQVLIIGIAIGLNLILVAPSLMPAFAEINLYDEAKYIESGARLLDFQLRHQALGPLVAVPYALLHALFGRSPNWFMLEAWGGRFLLFVGLWMSGLYLAVKVGSRSLLFAATGVLFVSSYFIRIMPNQSDALFVILSALALASLVSFYRRYRFQDLCLGSALTALTTLARIEAILLLPLYAVMVVIIGWRKLPSTRLALGTLLPAIIVLGAFALASLASDQTFGIGTGSRAYDSFEWNQSILTGGDLVEAKNETDRLFGTREENEGSVLRAISRNPSALLERVTANLKTLPDEFLDIFGKRLGPFILLFAGIGALTLIRTGSVFVLGIFFVWALQPFVALAFIAIHIFPQIGYIILVLAAIGVGDTFGKGRVNIPKWGLILVAILISTYALLDQKPALLPGAILLGFVVMIVWIADQSARREQTTVVIGLMLALGSGLILRGPFSFPDFPRLGASSNERAVIAIQERLPAGSRVVVEHPGLAIAGRMEPVDLAYVQLELESDATLCEIIARNEIAAFYIPSYIAQDENDLWEELQSAQGACVGSPSIYDPGSIQVVFADK